MAIKDVNSAVGVPSMRSLGAEIKSGTVPDVLAGQTQSHTPPAPEPTPEDSDEDSFDTPLFSSEENVPADESSAAGEQGEDTLQGDSESASDVMEVKARGKSYKVNLKADDERTKSIIQWGLIAPEIQSQRDKARQDNKVLDKENRALKADNAAFQNMKKLAEDGFHEQAVRELLGDKFDQWFDEAYQLQLNIDTAITDEERNKWMQQKAAKADKLREKRLNDELDNFRRQQAEVKAKAEEEFLETHSATAAHKYRGERLGLEGTTAATFNSQMWDAAMAELAKMKASLADDDAPLGVEDIDKAFKSVFTKQKALIDTLVSKQTAAIINKKKAETKEQGSAIASRNYKSEKTAPAEAPKSMKSFWGDVKKQRGLR